MYGLLDTGPDIHGDPAVEVDRMLARQITMSPKWHARQNFQMGISANCMIHPDASRSSAAEAETSHEKRLTARQIPCKRVVDPPDGEPEISKLRSDPPSAHYELSSSYTSDDLPSPRELLERPTRAPARSDIHDLETKNWGIRRISRKRDRYGLVEYLIEWESSEIPASLIRIREDGSQHVCCGARDWDVERTVELASANATSDGWLAVIWKDSWVVEADLANAQEMLDDFDQTQRADAYRHECQNCILHEDSTSIRQRRGDLDNVFRPELNTDYGPAVRATISNHRRKSDRVEALLRAQPVRQTIFRNEFVDSSRTVNIDRASSRNATLAHDSGFEQHIACVPCEEGHGPFRECVAGNNDVGSCTNCLFDETGPKCNFHNRHPNRREIVRHHHVHAMSPISQEPGAQQHQLRPSSTTASSGRRSSARERYRSLPITEPTSPLEGRTSAPQRASPSARSTGTPSTSRKESSAVGLEGTNGANGLDALAQSAAQQLHQPLRQHTAPLSSHADNRPAGAGECSARERVTRHWDERHDDDADSAQTVDRSAKRQRRPLKISRIDPVSSSRRLDDGHQTGSILIPNRERRSVEPHSPTPRSIPERPHALCPGGMGYCRAFQSVSADQDFVDTEPVYDDMIFREGEATPAQVRFVLGRLSCENATLFEHSWQQHASKRKRTGKILRHTKETYISHALYARLNEAVTYCPVRPCAVVYGPGSRSGYPLLVDDEDEGESE